MAVRSHFAVHRRSYKLTEKDSIDVPTINIIKHTNKDIIQISPKINKMESQTQTTTVPPVSGTGNPGNETTPSITVSNGNQVAEEDLLTENNFPKPKPTPEEVKEPEDLESVEDRMVTEEEEKENKKQWEAYNGSDWSRYVALKKEVESIRQDGFSKSDEGEEDGKDSRHILANGEFRNRHEVNAHLLTQLCAVLETDADLTKRLEGYRCMLLLDFAI
jgi:hypothetical protein